MCVCFFLPWCVQNGKEISQGHTLILKDATFDNAGTYTCVVTVPEIEGMETSATLGVNVEGESDRTCWILNITLLAVI